MHVISYISSPTVSEPAIKREIIDIVDIAQTRNKTHDVTGVLFYANHYFFQTIEGNEPELREIYRSIERDSRHRDINILIDEPVSRRAFEDWSLDTFYIDNPQLINRETLELLQALYTRNFGTNTAGLIEFVRKMVDEMDTFKILQTPFTR